MSSVKRGVVEGGDGGDEGTETEVGGEVRFADSAMSLDSTDTEGQPFEEQHLTCDQLANLVELFLGTDPSNVLFTQLVEFFKGAYFETEEERHQRLLAVCFCPFSHTFHTIVH